MGTISVRELVGSEERGDEDGAKATTEAVVRFTEVLPGLCTICIGVFLCTTPYFSLH